MHESSDATAARPSTNARPLAAFGLLVLLWGYNWVVMKEALGYSGPVEFAVLRVGFGALCMFALLLALKIPLKPIYPRKTLLLGLFQTTGFVGMMSWSLAIGNAGKSAVLVYTMPFWVIIFGWPFLGERLQRNQWPAVALALSGLVLVLELWKGAGSANSVIALGAGASWAVAVIITKQIPVRGAAELLSLTTWQMIFGFVPLALAGVLVHERPIEWSGYFLGALAFNAVGCTAIATLLWLYILQRLPATVSGLSALIAPVIGVIAAWLQLGERPDLAEGIGMVLIVVALGLLATTARGAAEQQ
jgi:drug/metabolite transporter (DMT)-like permease